MTRSRLLLFALSLLAAVPGRAQWTDDGQSVFLSTPAKNVGIGTSSPPDKLTLVGSLAALAAPAGGVVTRLYSSSAGPGAGFLGTDTDNRLVLRTNAKDRVFLSREGNLGIGVDPGPNGGLTIQVAHPGWVTQVTNTKNNAMAALAGGQGYGAYFDAGAGAGAQTFALSAGASGKPFLYVRGDGNVGVGTNAPQAKLDVNGPASFAGSIYTADKVAVKTASSYPLTVGGEAYVTGNVGMGAKPAPAFQLFVHDSSPGYGHAGLFIHEGCPKGTFCTAVEAYNAGGGYPSTVAGLAVNYGYVPPPPGGGYVLGYTPYPAYAGYFVGNVKVSGFLTKAGGGFLIDHPQDPENKVLQHSFVESPDMLNVYSGVADLDGQGEARVALPGYFETLNSDPRYQLTALDQPMPRLHVKQRLRRNVFVIGGGEARGHVSWQVTGVRQDPVARKHRLFVEAAKGEGNEFKKGRYLYPEAYGKDPQEQGQDSELLKSAREASPREEPARRQKRD